VWFQAWKVYFRPFIFSKTLLEKIKEYGVNTYYIFVDFKPVHDSTDKAGLFKAMEEFHVPRKL
jgi:hypothetical protein